MTAPTLPDRLAGGVWGHLVGDATGVPYEFRQPNAIGTVRWGEKGSHRQPPGTWSDDGLKALLPVEWQADFEILMSHQERSGRGYVVDCFWSAWDAFSESSTYVETIERAIKYGPDTDTTACLAGGLAGIYWGLDAVPADWRNGMRGAEIVGVPTCQHERDRQFSATGPVEDLLQRKAARLPQRPTWYPT